MFEESSSENNDDNLRIVTTSLSDYDQFLNHSQPQRSVPFKFQYPVELPILSSKVVKDIETNNLETEWKTLIKELVPWILSKKLIPLQKKEFQAIGQTLYRLYPGIGRDGFRPWSHLCRCLSESLRKERYKRGFQSILSKN